MCLLPPQAIVTQDAKRSLTSTRGGDASGDFVGQELETSATCTHSNSHLCAYNIQEKRLMTCRRQEWDDETENMSPTRQKPLSQTTENTTTGLETMTSHTKALAAEWKFPSPMTRCPPTKAKKRVRFGTVTTFTFSLAYGGSAVPRGQGPPIGLAQTHAQQECQYVDEISTDACRRVCFFDHVDRILLLQRAGYSRKEVADMCVEAIGVRQSRECSVELANEDDFEVEPVPKRRRVVDP
ncbi:Aste57867_10363 [Aphanomyces stellatus]|uniref:Aste57867_10363 protein n=1 Tax=Aphanomyces stellatus TaxID=120398 RepID=A0A485KQ47_9STRA|nr:hypothetical protein As57867_010323 [Aphanomyces stellatus]VFT87237.1 Aste57867_10363 [Aphanomyces stellatus]